MVNPLIKDIIRLCSIHHQVSTNNTKVFTTLLSINDDRQIVQISPIVWLLPIVKLEYFVLTN